MIKHEVTLHRVTHYGRRTLLARVTGGLSWALVLVAACGSPERGPTVGSNSNWLQACDCDDDCGGSTVCRCGLCTADCSSDDDCDSYENTRCAAVADPATWATCQTSQPALGAGICLARCEPGDCGEGRACVAAACVLAPMPAVDFCAPVEDRSAADRTNEEVFLDLLQEMRANGGVTCGTDAPTAELPLLRLDLRLLCAARVFAADLELTRADSRIDSQGRDSEGRMALAGYATTLWGEGYVSEPASPADALSRMLADPESCIALTDANLADVGVGVSGQVYVVTLGSEPPN
jgi:hypothetical protein